MWQRPCKCFGGHASVWRRSPFLCRWVPWVPKDARGSLGVGLNRPRREYTRNWHSTKAAHAKHAVDWFRIQSHIKCLEKGNELQSLSTMLRAWSNVVHHRTLKQTNVNFRVTWFKGDCIYSCYMSHVFSQFEFYKIWVLWSNLISYYYTHRIS